VWRSDGVGHFQRLPAARLVGRVVVRVAQWVGRQFGGQLLLYLTGEGPFSVVQLGGVETNGGGLYCRSPVVREW
jgi:hypothetical protein